MAIDNLGIAAIITATGGTVAAIIGAIRVQGRSADKEDEKGKPIVDDRPELPPVPSSLDPAEILQFLGEVRADNVDLRARDREKTEKIQKLETTVGEMGEEIKLRIKVEEAFRRWLPILFGSWGKAGSPPLPAGEDLIILQDYIPRSN